MSARATRLAKFGVAGLSTEQRDLYDSILRARAGGAQAFSLTDEAGGLEGPFNAMLLCPTLGHALQALGAAVRFGGSLSDRAREIAILTVAGGWDSEFERDAHEAVGRAVGLSDVEIDAIRDARFETFTDTTERAAAQVAHAMTVDGDLSDELFVAASRELGPAVIFEITTLVGYYATLALQLRVFRVQSGNRLPQP